MLTHPDPKPTKSPSTTTQSPKTPSSETASTHPAPTSVPSATPPALSAFSGARARLKRRDPNVLLQAGIGILVIALLVAVGMGVHASSPRTSTSTAAQGATGSAPQVAVPAHQVYNAQPPAASGDASVNLQLTVKEALISIAPNVAYHAWTFNGTVPGPILRVRQGQTVNFTLINDGTMGHSIDFHAAQVAPNEDYRPIPPGGKISFSFTPQYPGVFLYHCGMSPVMDHVANGMYGAIIVDPANGWSSAQEYVLVQGEFYAQKNADGTYSLDQQKMMAMQPSYVAFNGYAGQYQAAPLTAQPNQKIRLFVVNAGPSEFSAFHVIGAIFSDYYPDGNPANHLQGDQTVTIPPGGGAVVELTIPDAGTYTFVTHSFAAAMAGAAGTIKVG